MSIIEEGIFMKKIAIILMITLVSKSNAFEDLQSTKYTVTESCGTFLDAASPYIEEYEDENNGLLHLDEYDQSITDNVTPPKVSTGEAMLKEALGALLIRYISLRETARIYLREFKNMLAQWYHNIIT